MDFQQFQRVLSSDPENIRARVSFTQAQARIHGPKIYLEPLQSLQSWSENPPPLQDLAIQEIANRLEGFSFLKTRSWPCTHSRSILGLKRDLNGMVSQRTVRTDTLKHRIASFEHIQTGIVFNLLPGQKGFPPFLIGRWGVTEGNLAKATQTEPEKLENHRPHAGVDWTHARELLKSWTLRLPSAQEWTYACRAGTNSKFFWGDQLDGDFLWYKDNAQQERKSYALHDHSEKWNPFGLIDMIGNTWEWVDIPVSQGGFLDEAKLLGSCCFASSPGEPPDFWFDGSPTEQIGFRAASTIPRIQFEKKIQIVVHKS
ncbi:MAG: SUMF1/EgtB/PvdO family nonheme iron enzyme [Planctomycetota bacterium]|nr:SUMF1/EgtB/PvdO family nonheme iron enzyme [Planctomycetota bacterium]